MRAPMHAVRKRMSESDIVEEEIELRRGPWTLEEDNLLIRYISRHSEGRWNMLAKCAGLKRTGKSCRLRWLNYLKPDIKRGDLTPQEQLLILDLHSKWGNRWSKIAQHLPGRTDNEIKNYWRTRVQKQARQLNTESNSKRFLDAVRGFYMPRLLQKMEQSSYNYSSMNPQSHHPLPSLSPNLTTPSIFTSCPPQNLATEISSSVTSPSLISTDNSIAVSNTPEVLQNYPTSPQTIICDKSVQNNSISSHCYYVESSGYDMEGINFGSMEEMGSFGNSAYEFQVGDGNWVGDDMADALWNMDDIWQFRELGEMGI